MSNIKSRINDDLKVGDTVIICDENSYLNGKDGNITKIKTDTNVVIVSFDKRYKYKIGPNYYQDSDSTTIEFDLNNVKKILLEENFEIWFDRVFPGGYNIAYEPKYQLSPENNCMYRNCKEKSVKRIVFNCWGTVSTYDVCEKHSEYHGMRGDEFPMKKGYKLKVNLPIHT